MDKNWGQAVKDFIQEGNNLKALISLGVMNKVQTTKSQSLKSVSFYRFLAQCEVESKINEAGNVYAPKTRDRETANSSIHESAGLSFPVQPGAAGNSSDSQFSNRIAKKINILSPLSHHAQ